MYFGEGKENVNRQNLREPEKTKMVIYDAIKAALKQSKNWNQFERLLKKQGIEIKYKFKGKSDEVQGISFSKGIYSFKGSEIDRSFSFPKLNQHLQSNDFRHAENQKASKPDQHTHSTSANPITSIAEAAMDIVGGIGLAQHGDDYEEESFARRMQYEDRKRRLSKKKGRRM